MSDCATKSGSLRSGLVVVSGPSGSGKTTICRRLLEHPCVDWSVSATTRPPRPGERNGKEYHFYSRQRFDEAIANDEFVEWAEVYGHRYGTLKAPLLAALDRPGRIYLLEIDVQGALQLQDKGFKGSYILVVPPSIEVLRERLEKRGMNDPADLRRRLDKAAWEMAQRQRYDFVIVNDDLETAVGEARQCLGLLGDDPTASECSSKRARG
ncbi:MAG: guanylate kinase [Planctomycetota bacterium]